MKCEEIYSLISDYLDNELDEELQEVIREHIETCKRCRILLRTIEETLCFSREIYKEARVPTKVISSVYYEIRIRYGKNKKNETK